MRTVGEGLIGGVDHDIGRVTDLQKDTDIRIEGFDQEATRGGEMMIFHLGGHRKEIIRQIIGDGGSTPETGIWIAEDS